MNEKEIRKYCRQVGKHLKCFRKTKAALLAGLREELLLSEDGKLPPPKETAAVLQESVSEKEQKSRATLFKALFVCIVLVAAVIFCIAILRVGACYIVIEPPVSASGTFPHPFL